MKNRIATFVFLCSWCVFRGNGDTASSTVSSKEVEELSFKAIKAIHKHLDDDQDGTVNLQESNEFMVDELHLDDKKRHTNFHHNDSLISVEDLWNSWTRSEVHNWTNEDVLSWLTDVVGLPQYKNTFSESRIDGRMLPRFTNESSSLYIDLGISNVKHRKKIYLLATDIVLFGPPSRDRTKDVILAVIVVLMTLACLYAFSEKKYAKRQMEQMLKDVECMQLAEENLKNTQKKLMEAEKEHVKTEVSKREIEEKLRGEIESAKKEAERLHVERSYHEEERMKMTLVEQELYEVRRALQKAEAEMESMQPRSSKALQQWLLITYRRESKHFLAKKAKALKQMEDAKDACDKIHKKRSSIFGPLRLVHSQTIDEVDQKILQARTALAEVTNDLQERQHRWRQIEELCGFPIVFDGLLGHAVELDENTRRSSVAEALAICANLGGIGSLPEVNPRSSHSASAEQVRGSFPTQNSVRNGTSFQRNVNDGLSMSGRSSPADFQVSRQKSKINRNSTSSPEQLVQNQSLDDDVKSSVERKSEQIVIVKADTQIEDCYTREHSMEEIKRATKESSQRNFHGSQSTPALSSFEHLPMRNLSLTSPRKGAISSLESLNKDDAKLTNKTDAIKHSDSSKDMLSFEIFSSEENVASGKNSKEGSNSNEERNRAGSLDEMSSKGFHIKKRMLKSLKQKKPSSFDQVSTKSMDNSEVAKRRSIFSKLKKK